ncbi:hypothetical protein KAR91_82420 [Candidatus Pacearchaeota archaeon]|nr:hypothetical protein [Candidatus Pacearchaeota archaeon]
MAKTLEDWQEQASLAQELGDIDAELEAREAVNSFSQNASNSSIKDKAVGALETAASIASGIVSEPAAGIAGLATQALTGNEQAALAVQHGVAEDLTFQPRTQTGQQFLQSTGQAVTSGLESGREFVGQKLPEGQFKEEFIQEGVGPAFGELASEAGATPAVAAIIEGLPSAAVEAIGLKGAGKAGRISDTVGVTGAPSEVIRKVFRGGEEGRQAVSETVEAFETATGEAPTLGQATGRQTLQAAESGIGKFVGGRPLKDQLEKISEGTKNKVQQIADEISTVKGSEKAGRVIQKGITGSDGFVDRFKGKSAVLWNKVDEFMSPEDVVDVSNTKKVLNDSISGGMFGNVLDDPKLVQINSILQNSPDIKPSQIGFGLSGKTVKTGGEIDYKTLKLLRSQIGRKLGSNELISDIPRADLKRLYGAISEDIKTAANNQSPDALKAFNRANSFTRSGHTRIDDFVERIAKKVDLDKVFDAVTKGGEGSQVINSFKRSLRPEEWNVVAANVVRRMGKSTAGRQDALGDAFSLDKFLTDYNKLGTARKSLFSGSKELDKYSKNLDQIATVAQRAKEASSELAGQSGTAQLASTFGIGSGVVASLLSGNTPLAASLVGLVGVNRGAAHLMSSPRFVKWLANATKRGDKDIAKSIGQLSILAKGATDAEARAINEYVDSIQEVVE